MKNPTRQSGMTLIGMILIFFLIGFFTLLTLKILPIYLEHFKVLSSLESLQETPELTRKSHREIRRLLNNRLDINMVEHVTPDDIQVSKDSGRVKVTVAYSVEKALFGNLSIIADFDDHIEVGAH